MKHVYLRQLLEWRVGVAEGWSLPVGNLGKGLKKRLPAELWAGIERCYAGADIADNWGALAQTMAVFRQVALEVGAALGYEYPDELHQHVNAYVASIQQLAASTNQEKTS